MVGRLIHDLEVVTGVYVAGLLTLGSLLSSLRGDVLEDEFEDA